MVIQLKYVSFVKERNWKHQCIYSSPEAPVLLSVGRAVENGTTATRVNMNATVRRIITLLLISYSGRKSGVGFARNTTLQQADGVAI